jgi:hypothetical protein
LKGLRLLLLSCFAVYLLSACSSAARNTFPGEGASNLTTASAKEPLIITTAVYSNKSYRLVTEGERIPVLHVVLRLANTSDSDLRVNLKSVELKVGNGQGLVQACSHLQDRASIYYLPAKQSRFVNLFITMPEETDPAVYRLVQCNFPGLQSAYCGNADS